jgi:hypothetical protein
MHSQVRHHQGVCQCTRFQSSSLPSSSAPLTLLAPSLSLNRAGVTCASCGHVESFHHNDNDGNCNGINNNDNVIALSESSSISIPIYHNDEPGFPSPASFAPISLITSPPPFESKSVLTCNISPIEHARNNDECHVHGSTDDFDVDNKPLSSPDSLPSISSILPPTAHLSSLSYCPIPLLGAGSINLRSSMVDAVVDTVDGVPLLHLSSSLSSKSSNEAKSAAAHAMNSPDMVDACIYTPDVDNTRTRRWPHDYNCKVDGQNGEHKSVLLHHGGLVNSVGIDEVDAVVPINIENGRVVPLLGIEMTRIPSQFAVVDAPVPFPLRSPSPLSAADYHNNNDNSPKAEQIINNNNSNAVMVTPANGRVHAMNRVVAEWTKGSDNDRQRTPPSWLSLFALACGAVSLVTPALVGMYVLLVAPFTYVY